MLSEKMIKALNEQISMEGEASHRYLAMACWCEEKSFENAAKFMFRQTDEEREHMMKIVHYVHEMNGKVSPGAFKKPPVKFKNIRDLFETAYQGEKAVTKSINQLVGLAVSESDFQTQSFLQWYVDEQREEEAVFQTILDKMDLIGDGSHSLYYVDNEIGKINEAVVANEGAE